MLFAHYIALMQEEAIMLSDPRTSYDAILYPGRALAQAHPDRLATLATLFGMKPLGVEACRVLELGCGDGINVISVAQGLPTAECIGIDLAGAGIDKGQGIIKHLGLRNVDLQQFDIMDVGDEFGKFDYIIAHGIYSWIPTPVRDKLLAICKANLTENGVAYISYNTFPGCHLRQMVRGMMRFHVSEIDDPRQKIDQGRALVKFLSESSAEEPGFYRSILSKEYERVSQQLESSVFHDDLSDVNHPVYFHEFVKHATQHGLQYLAEAQFFEMQSGLFDRETVDVVNRMADSRIAKEQYLDFLKCRSFRQTLLVHNEQKLDLDIHPEKLTEFYIASPIRPEKELNNIGSSSVETFLGPNKSSIKVDKPLVKAALVLLGNAWPQAIHFSELLSQAREFVGNVSQDLLASEKEDIHALGQVLLRAYAAGIIELHVSAPTFVTEPSQRPRASSLARLQAEGEGSMINLRHHNVQVEAPMSRALLRLLDGSRDRAALLDDLTEMVASGAATLSDSNEIPLDTSKARDIIAGNLEDNLVAFGRMALLAA